MEFETIHEMYRHWFDTRANLPAYHVKRGDRWEAVPWRAFEEKMARFAWGLMALGMEHRDPVTLLSQSREEWDISDKAVLSAGGVSVGCHPSGSPAQLGHVVHHSESRFLVVEDRRQWEKIARVRGDLPRLRRIIVIDPTGTEGQDLVSFEEVMELGRREGERYEEEYRRRFASVTSRDTAIIFYTSGTTGPPKGAMLTHGNILDACRSMRDLKIFSAQDTTVIWLPMPHIYGRIAQIAGTYTATQGYYAESAEKIEDNLKEIRPTIFYGDPRIFKKIHARILEEVDKASATKKRVFRWSLGVGRARSRLLQADGALPIPLRLKFRIADALFLKRIRNAFGGRVQIMVSGGAPISGEVLEFFHAARMLPLEVYGTTEALLCAMNRPDKYRFGSLGPAVPGVRIRIAQDGEILVKSDMVFQGYLKDEEKTREALCGEGWFATGDVGVVDRDGFVRIANRKKDILITASGENAAPRNIESLLKTRR